MAKFNELFRKVQEKEKLGSKKNYEIEFSTGFEVLDHYNGSLLPNGKCRLGVEGGRYLAIVGPSGSAKTTLGLQIGYSIVKKYDNGNIFLIDKERSTSPERFKNITGMSDEEYDDKVFHIRDEFYSETLYKLIRNLSRSKFEKFDEIKVQYLDKVTNTNIDILPPTVVIIDSLPMLTPKESSGELGDGDNKDELDGNMVAAQIAKVNTAVFRKIIPLLDGANIFLIVINHISTKIQINPYEKVTKQLNFMGQSEHLSGGKQVIYLANYIFKLSPGKHLKPDDDFGIKGMIVNLELIKSRSAPAGTSFQMVFEQVNGYDNLLTCANYLWSNKCISGGGKASYIEGSKDNTFTKKSIKKALKKDKEFKKNFIKFTRVKMLENNVVSVSDRVKKILKDRASDNSEEETTVKKSKKKKK